jgi:hypothetical protein
MRYFIPIIMATTCLALGIGFISERYYFWGGCFICGFILFLLRFVFMFIKDLEWISESLVDEVKLKSIKECSAAYDFVLNSIAEGKIKKGMGIEELNKVLSTYESQPRIYNLCGMAQSKRGSKNYFYGYGKGMPTPELCLIVTNGKLESVKHQVGLINKNELVI